MGTIKKFEDIAAWQVARELSKAVYSMAKVGALSKDFGMRDQLQRAAVSVGCNIAEGFERNGNKEFAKFLWIAKGSSGEVASQIYTALDVGYITQDQFDIVYNLARRCSFLIYKFIVALKASPLAGERYKISSNPSNPLP